MKKTRLCLRALSRAAWSHYRKRRRSFPWRPPELALTKDGAARDPYRVLLSEVMLQQTQAGERTLAKYRAFLKRFPTLASLARAPLRDVYGLWRGLGYNRRARNLRECARTITELHGGRVPESEAELRKLPGIGPYSAAAIRVFAFNKPALLVETNLRTVFLHHCFPRARRVPDAKLLPLIEAVLDRRHPREWYSALMDYGAALKRTHGNESRRSAHYVRQKPFKGSDRELRGKILRLLHRKRMTRRALLSALAPVGSERIERQLKALIREELLDHTRGKYGLGR